MAVRRTKKAKKEQTPGNAFETEIADICAEYLLAGQAKIEKVDPPSRTIGGKGFMRTILLPSPYLDFVGTLMPSGRCIMMECKLTEEPTLRILDEDAKGAGIKFKQLQNARRWMDAGACVCFLWRYNNETRILSPEMVEAQNLTRKSIPWMNAHRLYQGTGLITIDFLAAVRALYNIKPEPNTP